MTKKKRKERKGRKQRRKRAYVCHGRGFAVDMPVHVWTRLREQQYMLAHPAVKALVIALILRAAKKARVKIWAVAILDNHVHLLVSEGRIRWKKRRRHGIWPFMRNWKASLSRQLRVLGVSGCKFERPYQSIVCKTVEAFLAKYAYVLAQAERHGLPPECVLVSSAVLEGRADGMAQLIPDWYANAGDFGQLIENVIDASVALACGLKRKSRDRVVSPERRSRRRELERRRERRRALDELGRKNLKSKHWYAGARLVGSANNLPVDQSSAQMAASAVPMAKVDPRRYQRLAGRLRRYVLPPLAVTHDPDPDDPDRALSTTVVTPDGVAATTHWGITPNPLEE